MVVTPCSESPHRIACRTRAFPVRPQPRPREAAMGYLIRLAQANGFETPRQFWRATQTGPSAVPFENVLKRAGVSDRQRHFLMGPLPHYWKSLVSYPPGLVVNDYNHSFVRWCPVCLEKSPYLRGVWGLKLQCVCTKHQLMLADRCPACTGTQRFERCDVALCRCGAKLAAAERITVPHALCQMCVWLAYGSVGHDCQPLAEMDGAAWHRLVRFLGQFTVESQPQRPGQVSGLHRVEVATALITNATCLLESWPTNFNRLLAAIQAREPTTLSLSRSFWPLYDVLYFDLKAPCFQFLRDAFEAYLHENWWGFVCNRNRSLRKETVESHPRLTFRDAAGQAGTSLAVVRHLVQGELIASVENELPSGRHIRSIHQREIERIGGLAQGAMTLSEVSGFLALPERRLRELVKAGVLLPIVSRFSAKSAAWLFSRDSVLSLSGLTGTSQPENEVVSIKQILRTWRLRRGEFVALFKAIENKELLPATTTPTPLGEVSLDLGRAQAWLRDFRISSDDWLSVDQAARILGLKQQVAYGLVARGFLPSTATRSTVRGITVANLRAFNENYVSLAELARYQRHSPRWLLKEIDAVPVSGPSVDGYRQYFFLRSDLSADQRPPIVGMRMIPTTQND